MEADLQKLISSGSSAAKPVRWAVELLLVACLAFVLARIVLLVVSPKGALSSEVVSLPGQGEIQLTGPIRADLAILTRLNPFGVVDAETGTTGIPVEIDAPETDLNLVLRGLRAATGEGSRGTAYIVTPDNRLSAFQEGDEVIEGMVSLERVLTDRVILNRGGQRESLRLNDKAGPDGLSVIGGSPAQQRVEGGADVVTSGQAMYGRLRDPSALVTQVSLIPAMVNGQRVGLQVTGNVPPETGLRAGDVIRSVNGISLASAGMDQLVDQLRDARTLNLVLTRDNREATLRIAVGE